MCYAKDTGVLLNFKSSFTDYYLKAEMQGNDSYWSCSKDDDGEEDDPLIPGFTLEILALIYLIFYYQDSIFSLHDLHNSMLWILLIITSYILCQKAFYIQISQKEIYRNL